MQRKLRQQHIFSARPQVHGRDEEAEKLNAQRFFLYERSELKQKVVRGFERNLYTVIQLSLAYEETSRSIYHWIRKYSTNEANTVQVVQMKSEEHKTALLQQEVNELQRLTGQQRVLISLHDKTFDHVSEEVGYDVKKVRTAVLEDFRQDAERPHTTN